MKKIFTLCAAMLISAMSFAQMPGDPNAIPGSMVLETATITGNGSVAESDGGVKRLDYCSVGTIVTFALNNATEQAYDVTYTQGTCMDGIMLDFEIVDANNDVVWTTQVPVVNTALKNNDTGVNFEIYETETVGTTAVLPAGNYILNVYYNRDGVKGTYNGSEFDFTCNVSDITFTAVAGAGGGEGTAEGVVILSNTTLDRTTSTNDAWAFTGTEVLLAPEGGRDFTKSGVSTKVDIETGVVSDWTDGLNFKKEGKVTIMIPDGMMVYRMELSGFSQGDNWCYLYAYGAGEVDGWEWVEPKGKGVTDNTIINTECKYPVDPCAKTDVNQSYSFNHAGYTFAAIDFVDPSTGEFSDEWAYTGSLPLMFSGNNQMQSAIKLYVTKDAAKAAATGIESAVVEKSEPSDARMYNIAGQMVTESYKGIVIKNGKKYLNK